MEDKILNWMIECINKKYKDEVSLILGNNTLRTPNDEFITEVSFFIPDSERANNLASSFIIGSKGIDIYPISWDKMERYASLDEYNLCSLMNAKILYASKESDKRRFQVLQEKFNKNLEDEKYSVKKAFEKMEVAQDIYREMIFEDNLSTVRVSAGYIADYLSIAIALLNHTYFVHSQVEQMSELKQMKQIPKGFLDEYKKMIETEERLDLIKISKNMLEQCKAFIQARIGIATIEERNYNFQDLASWYEELSYTWQRIYYWCNENDMQKIFTWSVYLQHELDTVCKEFGLKKIDLIGFLHKESTKEYCDRARIIEDDIKKIILKNGGVIHQYRDVNDFLISR